MLIGSAYHNKNFDNLLAIRVGNELIRRTHVTKYLGFIVDDTLKWDLHIDYISKKIKKNIGVMKHVKSCVPKGSLQCYIKHLLNLTLNIVTQLGENFKCKLQTLQNIVARVVMGIKYEEVDHDLLASLGWKNVKQLVYYDTASLMYRIKDGTAPEYTQSMFDKCDTIHSCKARSARNRNFTRKMNSAKGQTAFVYFGTQVWNNLPLRIKEARSIDIFQERLKEHIFTTEDI